MFLSAASTRLWDTPGLGTPHPPGSLELSTPCIGVWLGSDEETLPCFSGSVDLSAGGAVI